MGDDPTAKYLPVRTSRFGRVPHGRRRMNSMLTIADVPDDIADEADRLEYATAYNAHRRAGYDETAADHAARAAVKWKRAAAGGDQTQLLEALGLKPGAWLAEALTAVEAYVDRASAPARRELARSLKLSESASASDIKRAAAERIRASWPRLAGRPKEEDTTMTIDPRVQLTERADAIAEERKVPFDQALALAEQENPELATAAANRMAEVSGSPFRYDVPGQRRLGEPKGVPDPGAQLVEKAEAIARERKLSFDQALEAAMNEHPQLVERYVSSTRA